MKRLGKKDRGAFAAIRDPLVILQQDVFDPRLGSHKLKGDLAVVDSVGRRVAPATERISVMQRERIGLAILQLACALPW